MTRIGIQRPPTVSYMVALEQWNICRFQTIYKMNTVVRLLWSEMFKSKIVYLKSKQSLIFTMEWKYICFNYNLLFKATFRNINIQIIGEF